MGGAGKSLRGFSRKWGAGSEEGKRKDKQKKNGIGKGKVVWIRKKRLNDTKENSNYYFRRQFSRSHRMLDWRKRKESQNERVKIRQGVNE